jgi:hypothetical protein
MPPRIPPALSQAREGSDTSPLARAAAIPPHPSGREALDLDDGGLGMKMAEELPVLSEEASFHVPESGGVPGPGGRNLGGVPGPGLLDTATHDTSSQGRHSSSSGGELRYAGGGGGGRSHGRRLLAGSSQDGHPLAALAHARVAAAPAAGAPSSTDGHTIDSRPSSAASSLHAPSRPSSASSSVRSSAVVRPFWRPV